MPLAGVGASVFHPQWNEHHRPTATASMDAACIITRPAGTGTTDADGTYTPDPGTTIYTGVCRIVPVHLTQEQIALAGETQETHRHYQVGVRYDVPEVLVGDLVDITMSGDTGLVGKRFRVTDIAYASEQWQRDLICNEREA